MSEIIKYENVKYEVFHELCKELEKTKDLDGDDYLWGATVVYYNGTNLYGDLSIDVSSGFSKVKKNVVLLVAEIFAKFN